MWLSLIGIFSNGSFVLKIVLLHACYNEEGLSSINAATNLIWEQHWCIDQPLLLPQACWSYLQYHLYANVLWLFFSSSIKSEFHCWTDSSFLWAWLVTQEFLGNLADQNLLCSGFNVFFLVSVSFSTLFFFQNSSICAWISQFFIVTESLTNFCCFFPLLSYA